MLLYYDFDVGVDFFSEPFDSILGLLAFNLLISINCRPRLPNTRCNKQERNAQLLPLQNYVLII